MERLLDNEGLIHVPEYIFGFLDPTSITKCLRVSKKWNNFLTSSKIWLIKRLEYLIFSKKYLVQNSELQPTQVTLVQVFPDWQEVFVHLQKRTKEELEIILENLRGFFFEFEDVNSRFRYLKASPLHYACKYGHLDFLEIMFKIPCLKIPVKDICQKSIVDFALEYGQVEVMKFLFNFDLVTTEDLFKACQNGQLEIVKLYFDQKPDFLLATSTPQRETILHFASKRIWNKAKQRSSQQLETVLFILQKAQTIGLDVNQRDWNGCNPFLEAAGPGQVELIQLYLDHAKEFGIDVHARSRNGVTFLYTMFQPKENFEDAKLIMDKYYEEFQWDLRELFQRQYPWGCTPLEVLKWHLKEGREQWKPLAEFVRNKIQNHNLKRRSNNTEKTREKRRKKNP